MFEVKSDVEMPRSRGGYYVTVEFPFDTMEIGQCFDIETEESKVPTWRNCLWEKKKAYIATLPKGKTFVTRTRYLPNEKILRVWRVKG